MPTIRQLPSSRHLQHDLTIHTRASRSVNLLTTVRNLIPSHESITERTRLRIVLPIREDLTGLAMDYRNEWMVRGSGMPCLILLRALVLQSLGPVVSAFNTPTVLRRECCGCRCGSQRLRTACPCRKRRTRVPLSMTCGAVRKRRRAL